MSLRIDPKETVPSNAERILQSFLDECRASLQNDDPHQAIHEARKTMKKMRAFSRLFRGEIGNKKYRSTNKYYRDIARKISGERDVSAMLDTVNKINEEVDQALCGQTIQHIKNHLTSRKAAISRIQINQEKLLDKLLEDLKEGETVHARWKIKNDDFSAFSKGIAITYGKCQKAMKKAIKKPTTENFHEWRKRSKYLRYEIGFLRHIWKKPMKALEKELHQLTDYLGEDHDLAVLRTYAESMNLENKDEEAALFSIMSEKRKKLQSLAKPLGKKILSESPEQFVARLSDYWKQKHKEITID
ncbi:CHAD domain-containing protein [Catalinimonas alkaloidigena]|uniref:CHAD domain-containing protein n=1 Tax=Catalinimonas alkaloidigena TaxID=1075417 RepID=UPI0024058B33|nr:CHAD domain-containing protein [Catalinimonas alkaloidigena]MDF9797028.1 CHAD domain-containing protein [Catalinimonas alkaloidigena]